MSAIAVRQLVVTVVFLCLTAAPSLGAAQTPVPTARPISNATGDVALNTTFSAYHAGIGSPPLPPCTNFEIVDVAVRDPNGTKFLRRGHFRL